MLLEDQDIYPGQIDEADDNLNNNDDLFENLVRDGLLINPKHSRNSPRKLTCDDNSRRFTFQISTGIL